MKKRVVSVGILIGVVCSSAFAGSRFSYDAGKIKAILDSRLVERKFAHQNMGRSIDVIELVSVSDSAVLYKISSKNNGFCSLSVELSFDPSVTDVKYEVKSVSDLVCEEKKSEGSSPDASTPIDSPASGTN